MSGNIFEELKVRGFVKQMTTEEENMEKLLTEGNISVYAGFDPTKDTLHVGHLIPIMVLHHLQKNGHRPICVVGGATAKIGDPSGKDSMREMLTEEQLDKNIEGIKKQLSRFMDFSEGKALLLNNFDWLGDKNYIQFIRDIGPHFTVNRMLTAECFKQRMEKGLTFLEFNYMLLQGYDFYNLHKEYNCRLEIGGDDQWSNIIAGIELVRRKDQKEVFGMTMPLLTTASGKKMGKTEGGSVWLDAELTTPYDYFQYWRNTQDQDVIKFMKLYTFLSLDKIVEYEKMEGAEINKVKEILAFETTKIVHGEEAARKALETARSVFAGGVGESAPTFNYEKGSLIDKQVADLAVEVELFKSKGEAKRMMKQNGLSMNDKKITDINQTVIESDIIEGKIILKKGKKNFVFVMVQ